MHEFANFPARGTPIVAELPRRPLLSPRAKRWPWRIAFAASDAVVIGAALASSLLLLAALFDRLPPIA